MEFKSQSQGGQDRFVWEVTWHKKDGLFLDIGANHPTSINNTYALEQQGWRGIMVDSERILSGDDRKSPYLQADATKVKWLFQLRRYGIPNLIDYLSLDVDDATLNALLAIPLDHIRFNVATIETDRYRLGDGPRNAIREIMLGHGYDLVCEDVKIHYPEGQISEFEDWYVSPELSANAERFRSRSKIWNEILDQA